MRRFARATLAATLLAAFWLAPGANAAEPTISSIGVENLRASATFASSRSDYATFYFASRPDRTADGEFLEESVVQVESVPRPELQAGTWSSRLRLDPGFYYVLLKATRDFDGCYLEGGGYDEACAHGWSNMATLTVPEPVLSFRWSVSTLRRAQIAFLRLSATPLGERRPYRVCYRTLRGKDRCASGVLNGFDWSSSGRDSLSISTRGLPAYSIFTWYIGSAKIVSERIRVR